MCVIQPAPRPCILLRDGLPAVEFASREEAFAAIRQDILRGRFGQAFAAPVYRTNWFGAAQIREAITYILIDVLTWRPLRMADFAAWLPRREPWGTYRYRFWNGAGPVPWTGRQHGHRGTTMRRPATQASRRMATAVDTHEIGARPVAGHNLPSDRDDFMRSDLGQKNWKRYRKTQWL